MEMSHDIALVTDGGEKQERYLVRVHENFKELIEYVGVINLLRFIVHARGGKQIAQLPNG